MNLLDLYLLFNLWLVDPGPMSTSAVASPLWFRRSFSRLFRGDTLRNAVSPLGNKVTPRFLLFMAGRYDFASTTHRFTSGACHAERYPLYPLPTAPLRSLLGNRLVRPPGL